MKPRRPAGKIAAKTGVGYRRSCAKKEGPHACLVGLLMAALCSEWPPNKPYGTAHDRQLLRSGRDSFADVGRYGSRPTERAAPESVWGSGSGQHVPTADRAGPKNAPQLRGTIAIGLTVLGASCRQRARRQTDSRDPKRRPGVQPPFMRPPLLSAPLGFAPWSAAPSPFPAAPTPSPPAPFGSVGGAHAFFGDLSVPSNEQTPHMQPKHEQFKHTQAIQAHPKFKHIFAAEASAPLD